MIPPKPIRVLLIDNEPDFLEALSFWLTSHQYEVKAVTDGRQGVALIQREPFDVVFLDVVMPQMDGLEVLRRIRAFNKTLPVILVTASPGDENRFAGARSLGISGFFPKADSLEQLSEMLEVALRMIRRSSDSPATPAASSLPRGVDAIRDFFTRLISRTR